jgi:hypothetical protein
MNTLVVHFFLFLNGPVCYTRHDDDTAHTIDDDDFATFRLLKYASCLGLLAAPAQASSGHRAGRG